MFDNAIAQPYVLFATMWIAGVLAFCLHKVGHGRVEEKEGLAWNLLALGAGPLIPVGVVGSIIATIWALFALSFWKVASIFLLSQLLWGSVCWYALGHARVYGYEPAIHAVGIPVVLTSRAIEATAAVLLLIGLWRGYP